MTSAAGRAYARALFELARENRSAGAAGPDPLDRLHEEVRAAREALFDDRGTRDFLSHRLISRAAKKKLVRDAFGGVVEERLLVLLFLLVDRGRTALLGEVEEEFARLVRLAHGVRNVTLASAFPLAGEEASLVTRALEERLNARVELDVEVRPSLIGGVVATSEGREIEFSIEGRLRSLAERLRGSGPEAGPDAASTPPPGGPV